MTISSLTQVYSNISNSLPTVSNKATTANTSAIDSLSTIAQQDLVSLTSLKAKQSSSASQTYNAQGLLQQIQANVLSNDQLLISGTSTSSSSSVSDSLLQGLLSPFQTSSTTDASNANAQLNSTSNVVNSSADLATMLKKNPSMVTGLIQSQKNQSLLSIFN